MSRRQGNSPVRFLGGEATIIDLSSSRHFTEAPIAAARHAVRSRLDTFLAPSPPAKWRVFTSKDVILARFAAREAKTVAHGQTAALMGGNQAWREASFAMVSGSSGIASDLDDVWLRPYDDTENVEQAMRDYPTWEVALVAQIKKDGTASFERWE